VTRCDVCSCSVGDSLSPGCSGGCDASRSADVSDLINEGLLDHCAVSGFTAATFHCPFTLTNLTASRSVRSPRDGMALAASLAAVSRAASRKGPR